MTLQLSLNAAQTELTVTSDRRKHPPVPAVTQPFRITVETGGETQVYTGTREVSPAVPASTDPIKVADDSGVVWSSKSDDGTTAVYSRAI